MLYTSDPSFFWNLFLYDSLPKSYSSDIFWQDIPKLVGFGENILRVIVFGLPVTMILSFNTRIKKFGLLIYLTGIGFYFLSWVALIYFPQSGWSCNLLGFMAPAYTPIIWLIGIGLIGNRSFFKIPKLSLIYICISVFFVVLHVLHTYIIFQRL